MNKILFKKNKPFIIIFLLALLVRIVYFFDYHELLWDSGVYIGMGKNIFSLGSIGLWENIRPIVLPAIFGFVWFLKIDPLIFGGVIEFLFSAGCIFLVYLITLKYFDKTTAILSTIIFSLSGIFFYLGFHLYSEIPSLFFVLSGIYFLIKKKYYLSGFSTGIAFLTKFPAGMFIIPIIVVLILNKDFKKAGTVLAGFFTLLLPYLSVNYLVYGNPLSSLINARESILNVLGCNYLRYNPRWFYFDSVFKDNFLHIFSLMGLYHHVKNFKKQNLLILLNLVLPLVYFIQLHCRDIRYIVLFIPFIAMFSGYGITKIKKYFNKKSRNKLFLPMVILVFLTSLIQALYFYDQTELEHSNKDELGYLTYLKNKEINGEIWSSNPLAAVYVDEKIHKIYYPVYNSDVASDFYHYLTSNTQRINYVLLDNCGGGIICHPGDLGCIPVTDKIISFLEENFDKVYYSKRGNCHYRIYKN